MADTYKGLTIKIGGDTTQLVQALRASDTAIRQTQKQLQTLTKAARLDGTDANVLGKKFEVMADEATATTRRLHTMQQALSQVATTKLDNSAIKALAANTTEATYKAEKAREAYASVVDQIKALKNQVAKPMQLALADDLKEAEKRLEALNSQMKTLKASEGFSRNSSEFKELNAEIKQAATRVNELRTAVKSDPFANLEIGSEKVRAKMKELGATEEQLAQYTKLLNTYFTELENRETAKVIAEYKDLEVEIKATETNARALHRQLVELNAANPAATQTQEFRELAARMQQTGTVAEQLRQRLSTIDNALTFDATSVDLLKAKFLTLREQVSTSEAKLAALNAQLKTMDYSGALKLQEKYGNLGLALEEAKAKATSLNTKLDELKANGGADKQTSEFKQLKAAAEAADSQVDQLSNALRAINTSTEISAVKAELKSLGEQASTSGIKLNSMRGAMQQLGWSMYSTVMPAITQFGYYAINSADEIDSAYRDMRKTVQGTDEQFEQLLASAKEFSTTHVTSADTLLEIEAMGGQLGVATDKLEEFATTVSNLEIATDLDADTAAEQLGQLSGILNDMTQDDFAKYGDALTRLGNNNATLESKISNVMLRIASMGTITGFTTPQLLAWSTAVAATGQGAESAGTAISKTMSNIETAVGAGGEKLESFAAVANMSAEQFASSWNTDPSGTMYAFIQGLKDIEANGGSADATLGNLGITSVRQKQAILGLMQTIDGLNSNIQMSEDAWNGVSDAWGDAGDAAREAERKAEGFSGALAKLQNSFQVFSATSVESLTPILQGLAEIVAGFTSLYAAMPECVQQFVLLGAAGTAGLSGLLIVISAVVNAWTTFSAAFGEAAAIKKAQAAIAGTSTAAETLALKLGVATEGLIGSQAAMKLTTVAAKGLKVAMALAATAGIFVAMEALTALVGAINDAIEKQKTLTTATDSVKKAAESFPTSFEGASSSLEGYSSTIQDVIDETYSLEESVTESANSIADSFAEVQNTGNLVQQYTDTITELAGACDGNIDKQQKLAAAVSGLNSICGTTYSIIDETSGALNVSTDELNSNSQAWIANTKAQAAQEALVDVQKELLKLTTQRQALETKISENTLLEGTPFETYSTDVAELKTQLESCNEQIDLFSGMETTLTAEAANATAVVDGATDSTSALGDATDEAAEATDALIESIDNILAQYPTFQEAFGGGGATIEAFAAAFEAAGGDVESLASDIESFSGTVNDAFNLIEQASDASLDTMLSNMQENASLTQTWAENIKTLYAQCGTDSERAFVENLASMGPQYATQVQALIDDTTGKLAEFGLAWENGTLVAVNGAAAQAGQLPQAIAQALATGQPLTQEAIVGLIEGVDYTTAAQTSGNDIGTNLATSTASGISNNSSLAQSAMAGLIEGVDYVANSADESAAGANTGQSYASGVQSKTGEAASAAQDVVMGGENEMDAAKATAWNKGAAVGSNYAVGIWAKMGEASRAGSDVAQSAVNSMSNYSSHAYQWGAHMGSNFAAGLWSKVSEASSAANAVASAAAASLEHTIAPEGPLHNGGKGEKPWGAHTIQNYIAGMESQIPELQATMAKVTNTVASYMAASGSLDYVSGKTTTLASPTINVNTQPVADLVRERGGTSSAIVINVDNATLNDDAAMQQAALNFMNELARMNRLNRAGA